MSRTPAWWRCAWPAISQAQRHQAGVRLPFCIAQAGRPELAGSVARAHLPELARWPQALRQTPKRLLMTLPADERDDFFADANRWLHAQGLLIGWRDETYALRALPAPGRPAATDAPLLARLERTAARFWGSSTCGAHCNGYLADGDGRPSHLWIARRAFDKPTDPGLLDNLIGGGVPWGQSAAACVQREGWEEAGLTPAQMTGLRPGRRIAVHRDIVEGLQLEDLSSFDLLLPPNLQPVNQDGEVHSHMLMPVDQALRCAAAGEMTVDAALVTLDFALRHALLPAPAQQRLGAACAPLWLGPARLDP